MERENTDTKKSRPVLTVLLKIALTLAAAGAAFMLAVLGDLFLRSGDIHMPVICLVCCLLPFSLPGVIWVKKRKKYFKFWLAGAAFCLVVLGVDFAAVKHNKALTVDTTRYYNIIENLPDYEPFDEDSKLPKFESETLRLSGDLPVLDGSVAFHPLYSAFVRAVYPESDELYYGSFDHVQSWGYREMAEKISDIFFTLDYPTEEQEAYALAQDCTYEYTTVGTEALVFIVNKDNPLDNLSTEQLQAIYAGEITNWKELGGRNRKIKAFQNEPGGSQRMMERFMGERELMPAPAEMVYDSLYHWVEDVSPYRNKANSIGFSFSYCVKDQPDIKLLSVDGVAPTQENIENGTYKAVAPILAVTYEENTNENVDILLDWILSEEGQYVIRQTGYAGVVPEYWD